MSIIEREHAVKAPAVTTRDVLHRAADLLEEFGWCKGALARDANGNMVDGFEGRRTATTVSFCELGALISAGRDFGIDWAVIYFNSDGRWGDRYERMDWNDAKGRTKGEVVARLRGAAEAS